MFTGYVRTFAQVTGISSLLKFNFDGTLWWCVDVLPTYFTFLQILLCSHC